MKRFHKLKREVGTAVLAKYEHKCTVCGSENVLCVHHIIPMKPDNPDYNNIENLTVLCRSCHLSHHRKAGDIVPKFGNRVGNQYGRRGKVPPIKCSIDGCDNWQHGNALCKKHYMRKWRKLISKNKGVEEITVSLTPKKVGG